VNARLLVAGIGNIFLGDDAFGIEVIKRLQERPLPEDVVVQDFGIRSYDLAYALMESWDLVVLVDALPRGGAPGTLYTLEPQLPGTEMPPVLDAHSMDPVSVLQLVRALGGACPNLILVGCEPASVEEDAEGKFGLSPPVTAAVDEAIRVIEELMFRARSQKTAA
jgi:hydrogenase maturation protease